MITDPDLIRLRRLRDVHNGFDLAPCAAYSQAVADLTDETAAVRCVYHRDRAATYAAKGQPPLCSVCAVEALVWPETRHAD